MFKDFRTMLDAQEALNSKYNPTWRESVVIEQQLSAAFTELAEWFESAPRSGGVTTNGIRGWKFWKRNLEDDHQNKRIEVIDVWHFMMSVWLYLGTKDDVEHFVSKYNYCANNEMSPLKKIHLYQAKFTMHSMEENLEKSVFAGMTLLKYLMDETDMTWSALENGYFVKNQLNHARVDGGYQDGHYTKHDENGNEDNASLNV
jgi:dimeric dUTPase (all-alpha-NTP-PPase superfamily)